MTTLRALPETLSVVRLPAGSSVPPWATAGRFFSVTRTAGELSVVCEAHLVPADAGNVEAGFRAMEVAGPLDFALTGILSAIAAPLADAEISIFAISTFDTDYVLVRSGKLEAAQATLRAAGFDI